MMRRSRPTEPDRPLHGTPAGHLDRQALSHPYCECTNEVPYDGQKALRGRQQPGPHHAQAFLEVNGVTLERDSEAFFTLTIGVAEGRIDKPAVAAELERIANSRPAT